MVPSTQDAPRVTNLPTTTLHENDTKFISEAVTVISTVNGSNAMKVRVHDKLPSTYTITIRKPPKLTSNTLNQLQLLNSRLKQVTLDFNKNRLMFHSWKYNRNPIEKKRTREEEVYVSDTLPKSYNLSMVDKNDKKHISGIVSHVIASTEMEFNLDVQADTSSYELVFTEIEPFDMKLIERMVQQYGTFLTEIVFDFPSSALCIHVRRNDCKMESITTLQPRKRVKLK